MIFLKLIFAEKFQQEKQYIGKKFQFDALLQYKSLRITWSQLEVNLEKHPVYTFHASM